VVIIIIIVNTIRFYCYILQVATALLVAGLTLHLPPRTCSKAACIMWAASQLLTHMTRETMFELNVHWRPEESKYLLQRSQLRHWGEFLAHTRQCVTAITTMDGTY